MCWVYYPNRYFVFISVICIIVSFGGFYDPISEYFLLIVI